MRSYWWATAAQDSRGEAACRLPYGGRARRRADGEPGLIDGVRWRNVGRLAVLLAAGLLIALGPRGCGENPASLPPETRIAPPAQPPATDPAGRRPHAPGPGARGPAAGEPRGAAAAEEKEAPPRAQAPPPPPPLPGPGSPATSE